MHKRGSGKKSSVANERGAGAAARSFPKLNFKHDPDLPISAQREAIMQAMRRSQVLIVAGDTGSGKSTQLPQYCLEAGRGTDALIAHTRKNAFLVFQEDNLGAIQPGKLADLLVLDRDYLTIPAEQIKDIKPVITMVGGRIVYDSAAEVSTNRLASAKP